MKKLYTSSLLFIMTILMNFNQVQAQNYFTQNTTNGLPTSAIYYMDIGDVENDGDLDMIVAGLSNVYIYTNDGSGNFTLLSGVSFSSVTYDYGHPRFIDIDNDNDLDVVIFSANFGSTATSQLYRNDGGSTFTQIVGFPAANMENTEIAIGDFNGNGYQDIIVAGRQISNLNQVYTPFINDGSGNFSTTLEGSSTNMPWRNNGYQPITLTNLDGSGGDDLLISYHNSPHSSPEYDLSYFPNTTILTTRLLQGNNLANENHLVADLDGDGDNDIIGNLDINNYILLNNGFGSFTQSSQTLIAGQRVALMAAGDVDNDGDIDVLRIGKNAAGNAYLGGLYINDSKANFYLDNVSTFSGVTYSQSKFADMNGDNYPEFITVASTIKYYDNTYVTNHPDKAVDFDGTNYYTTSHEAALNALPITIEFSVQTGNYTEGLLNKITGNNGFQVGMVGGRIIADYKVDASNHINANQIFDVFDGNWHHVALVVESTGMKVYGDGVLVHTAPWTGTAGTISNSSGLELGNWSFINNEFSGNLDEVRIWNTARSHAEIVNNMCGKISNPKNEANLVAYYTMDDYVSGNNILFDRSSKNKTMTITGGSQALAAERVSCTPPVLPVEFLSFTGHLENNNNVVLNWSTATEKNNKGFEIERSEDGENWENIGFVHGNGTTAEVSDYEFTDDLNRVGLYYRLKQIDLDGKYEYSNIINITIEQSNNQSFNIYPNPASDVLNIETNQPVFLQIMNTTGQVLKEQQINSNSAISLKDLPNGIYYVQIGEHTQKLVIQK